MKVVSISFIQWKFSASTQLWNSQYTIITLTRELEISSIIFRITLKDLDLKVDYNLL